MTKDEDKLYTKEESWTTGLFVVTRDSRGIMRKRVPAAQYDGHARWSLRIIKRDVDDKETEALLYRDSGYMQINTGDQTAGGINRAIAVIDDRLRTQTGEGIRGWISRERSGKFKRYRIEGSLRYSVWESRRDSGGRYRRHKFFDQEIDIHDLP